MRRFVLLLGLLLVAGCSQPAANAPAPQVVNLVDPNYPPAVAGAPGWTYHKSLSADLDGDGAAEKVSITNNAYWDAERQQFGWDDGHPWHLYVEEPDGAKTYVFSGWVQMGQLDVILDEAKPGFYIVNARAGSLQVYRVAYSGPGRAEAVQLLHIPLSQSATFENGQ
ncbi:MAG TPA: hypothetical protein VNT01_03145 [Symbiobacteriaceae bacterium]|nr:hypothetical protein [Symbiobacteriaceae bacterium]